MDLATLDWAALMPFIAIGFAAQAVDGALGMAFGVITNTALVVLLGLPPAAASAKVHLVECATTAVSGISHFASGNIEWQLFWRLLIPGIIGGVTGAYLLSNIDGSVVKPFVLAYLALMGGLLLVRGLFYPPKFAKPRIVSVLGLVGGFLDAAGGGGWGPVVTSNLLAQSAEPRKTIGTVNAVEFFLTVAVSATFLLNIGWADLGGSVIGLLVGGMIAAPFGAMMARRLPAKTMLVLVGIVLIATSIFGLGKAISQWG